MPLSGAATMLREPPQELTGPAPMPREPPKKSQGARRTWQGEVQSPRLAFL